ncbi:aldo/keto reductase [Sphaerisporangium flaviroseum]|uniref:Aldo/keto reductase n=1 Tax=Sphaerisporangium flaviroseum TaxID=509199 RepID=A0ABP7HX01_9ACTN
MTPTTLTLGDLTVARLGFGALRLDAATAGERAASTAILRRAVELGVTFIDTADSYDLGRNEELIAEALHPYPADLVIGTKAGQCHPGDEWIPLGRPEYLRQQAELSLRRLRVDCIELFQLHRIDPAVPLADQVGALKRLQDEGKIRHIGLSEVTIAQLTQATEIAPIVSVQNLYNLHHRRSERLLEHCEQLGIAFIPWLPVQPSAHAGAGEPIVEIADRLGLSTTQVALAWLLHRSAVMLPIPGTSKLAHLEENLAAAHVVLSDTDLTALDPVPMRV